MEGFKAITIARAAKAKVVKRSIAYLTAILMILTTSFLMFSQAETTWYQLNLSNSNQSFSVNPSVASDSSGNTYMVWQDDVSGNYEIYFRQFSGDAWTPNLITGATNISNTPAAYYPKLGISRSPDVAVDGSGNVHVVWMDFLDGNYDIYYRKYNPSTDTWTPSLSAAPKNISTTYYTSLGPSICTNSSGIHVVWAANERIYYSSSSNGTSWSSAFNVSETMLSSAPKISAGPSNSLNVVWQYYNKISDEPPEYYFDVFYRRFNGSSWEAKKNISNTALAKKNSAAPDVASDSTGIYCVWHEGGTMTAAGSVYFSKSTNGSSWPGGSSIAASANSPAIATGPAGTAYAVYAKNANLYYRKYTGGSWQGEQNLVYSTGQSDLPAVCVDSANNVHVVWQDSSLTSQGSYWDILYKTNMPDTAPPSNPTDFSSPSHTLSTWSSNNAVQVNWSGATDNLSGVYEYCYKWSTSPTTIPDQATDNKTTGTSATSPPLPDSDGWYVHVKTRDSAGNWSSGASHYGPFYIDKTPPSIPPSASSPSHALSTWSANNIITVDWTSATDNLSEVDGYSYQWSNSATTIPDTIKECEEGQRSATSSPLVPDSNSWYLHIRTRDNAGNWSASALHYGPFWIDTTFPPAPIVTSSTHPTPTHWYSNNSPQLSWEEPYDVSGVVGYSYEWDQTSTTVPDSTIEPAGLTKTYTGQADGLWYFHIKAKDGAGAWGQTRHFAVRIDTAAPDTTIDSAPSGTIDYRNPTFAYHGNDPGDLTPPSDMRYSYKLEGYDSNWSTPATDISKQYAELPNGDYIFKVKAVDLANNEDSTPSEQPFTVYIPDSEPPDTFVDTGPVGVIDYRNVDFTYYGTDNQPGMLQYSYMLVGYDADWSSWTTATTKSYTNLANGEYTFKVKAMDLANNEDPTPDTRSFIVYVNNPPETYIDDGPSSMVLGQGPLTFTYHGEDDLTPQADLQYSCMLVGKDLSWSAWTSSKSKTYNNLSLGSYVFKVKAKDDTGLVDLTPAERAFTRGLSQAAKTWYFAEGYTGGGFQEWLTLQNPNGFSANATIEYSFRGGGSKTQSLSVDPKTRATIDVNAVVGSNKEVSVKIYSDQAIIAERPMYFNFNGISGGHNVVGTNEPRNNWYFAEGYTGPGFQEWLTLQNPGLATANVAIEYSFRGGGGTIQTMSVNPKSRSTIDVNAAAGSNKEVSVKISSDQAIIAERPMYFNFNGINGGHDVVGATASNKNWYFAEGYTGPGFQEWLTLQNPNGATANVTIQYSFRGGGGTTQIMSIYPKSRSTVDVNMAAGTNKEVSIKITADQAIIAERPMYFNFNGINDGHDVVGANASDYNWYFAEGYTGSGFQEWLTLLNPNGATANITIQYSFRGGGGKTQTMSIGPNSRSTVDVNTAAGTNKEVSIDIMSDQKIIAERPMYFSFSGIDGGHNVVGYCEP